MLHRHLCILIVLALSSTCIAEPPSFKDQTRSYIKNPPSPSIEQVWSHSEYPWQVMHHQTSSKKAYYAANVSSADGYMTLSALFTPNKHCDDGKTFIAIKLSSPAPFSARKPGIIATRFDNNNSTSITADYIFTEGSHIIWVDMPESFLTRVKRFSSLHIRIDDYIQGQPAREVSLLGSQKALQKAQSFCYRLLRG